MPPTKTVDPIQEGARETLERIAAEKAEKADPPSGIEFVSDFAGLTYDATDPKHYEAAHDFKVRPDRAYRWISTDPRVIEKRFHQGWSPVKGGSVRWVGTMLAERPIEMRIAHQKAVAERQRLLTQSPSTRADQEIRQAGGLPFDGNKSPKDGLGT